MNSIAGSEGSRVCDSLPTLQDVVVSNPSKAKGTAYECELLGLLRDVFGPGVDRSRPGTQSNDFHGIPFPIEAKHCVTWNLRSWIRKIRVVSKDGRWLILAADGDRRKAESMGDVAILPRTFVVELLDYYFNTVLRDE